MPSYPARAPIASVASAPTNTSNNNSLPARTTGKAQTELEAIQEVQSEVCNHPGISDLDRALLNAVTLTSVTNWKEIMARTCSNEIVDLVSQFAIINQKTQGCRLVRSKLRHVRLEHLNEIAAVAQTHNIKTLRDFIYLADSRIIGNPNMRLLIDKHYTIYANEIASNSDLSKNLQLVLCYQNLFEHSDLDALHNVILNFDAYQFGRFVDILQWDEHDNPVIRNAVEQNYDAIINNSSAHENMRWIVYLSDRNDFIDLIAPDINALIRGTRKAIGDRYEAFIRRIHIEWWGDHNNPFVNAFVRDLPGATEANTAFIKALSERNKAVIRENIDTYRNTMLIVAYARNCPELIEQIKLCADVLISRSYAECEKEIKIQWYAACKRATAMGFRSNTVKRGWIGEVWAELKSVLRL